MRDREWARDKHTEILAQIRDLSLMYAMGSERCKLLEFREVLELFTHCLSKFSAEIYFFFPTTSFTKVLQNSSQEK